jgi:hypothetical protein
VIVGGAMCLGHYFGVVYTWGWGTFGGKINFSYKFPYNGRILVLLFVWFGCWWFVVFSNMSWITLVCLIIGDPFYGTTKLFGFFDYESIVFFLYKYFEVSYYSCGVSHRGWLGYII